MAEIKMITTSATTGFEREFYLTVAMEDIVEGTVASGVDVADMLNAPGVIEQVFAQLTDATKARLGELHNDRAYNQLHEMHSLVAGACVRLGDDPEEVPCDLWRLMEHVDLMLEERKVLAQVESLVKSAIESDQEKSSADPA